MAVVNFVTGSFFSCASPNDKLKTLKRFSSLSRLIPGRFAGLGEGHRPIDERLHRRTEGFPKLGEFIFHLWWKLRMNGSLHQVALLKETHLLRQHTLLNAGDGAFKLREWRRGRYVIDLRVVSLPV